MPKASPVWSLRGQATRRREGLANDLSDQSDAGGRLDAHGATKRHLAWLNGHEKGAGTRLCNQQLHEAQRHPVRGHRPDHMGGEFAVASANPPIRDPR